MRAIEIDLFPREETRGDDIGQFEDELQGFLGCLNSNGNLCGSEWVVLELEDRVQVRAQAPADDALEPANWSVYAHKASEKLNGWSHKPLELRIVPEAVPDEMCCDCANSSSFILSSTYLSYELPVDCLDCGRPIPLYRLPYLDDYEEHWTLRQWHKNYQTLDQLYMNSWWGERMAYVLLSNPRASFIKDAREVAAKLEAATHKPVYVFLLNVYEQRVDACPRCNRPWLWPDSTKELYAFKCDHCRLISQQPTGDPNPDFLSEMHP